MGKAKALVDTDVVSLFFKDGQLGIPYRKYMRKRALCISFMTRAEFEGIAGLKVISEGVTLREPRF